MPPNGVCNLIPFHNSRKGEKTVKAKIVVLLVLVVSSFLVPAPARAQEISISPLPEVLGVEELGVVAPAGADSVAVRVVELRDPAAVMQAPWKAMDPNYPDLFGTLDRSDPGKKSGYVGSYGWVPKDAISCKLVGLALPKPSSPDFAGDFVDFVLTVEVPSSGWAEIGRVRVVNGDYVGTAWGYGEAEIPPVVVGWVQGRRVGVFAYSYRESAQSVFYVWKVTFTCQVPMSKTFISLVSTPKRPISGEPF
ncbi:hypothetical protein L6255_01090 [Candidatus Parcubacteria bacterium]|nr:hypothetical protein [Candidatus Parcubacteria bacterium]